MLDLLNEAVRGLREELGESRNNNRQLHEKQRQVQRMEEERNMANGEIRKNIITVQTQEDRRQEGFRYEQANVPKNSNVWLKREVKFDVPPPGLTYGGWGEVFLTKHRKIYHRRQSH